MTAGPSSGAGPGVGSQSGSVPGSDPGSEPGDPRIPTAAIVGTGLIGASIGMALSSAGWDVVLHDLDPEHARRAAELGAGRVGPAPGAADDDPADVAVLAMGPGALPGELVRAQRCGLALTYMDVASVKARPFRDSEALGADLRCFVGSHPMAGRERSGPGAARADLFEGRSWVVVPGLADASHVARVEAVIATCGARPVPLDSASHDEAMAVVSHVPQILASLVAGRLADASGSAVALAGQGVRDVTRIAASDAELWVGILEANAAPVRSVLAALRDDLDDVVGALGVLAGTVGQGSDLRAGPMADADAADADAADARAALQRVLVAGAVGRRRLPGKHGAPPTTYATVPVVVADRWGELARLLADAGSARINVEDVSIEHSPGQPVGLVELAVRPEAADALTVALRELGWTVHR